VAKLNQQVSPVVNSLEGLADNLEILSQRFGNNVAVMAVKAGIVAVEAAAVRTPVDTSLARSNWQLDTLKPTVVRPPIGRGRNLGIDERSVLSSVVTAAKISGRSIPRAHVLAGRKIWVSNPTPYIGDLNAGSSAQNREGNFDIIAVQLADGFIKSYVRSGKLLTIVDSV